MDALGRAALHVGERIASCPDRARWLANSFKAGGAWPTGRLAWASVWASDDRGPPVRGQLSWLSHGCVSSDCTNSSDGADGADVKLAHDDRPIDSSSVTWAGIGAVLFTFFPLMSELALMTV